MNKYYLEKNILNETFLKAEKELLNSKRFKFKKSKDWRNVNIPEKSGIFIIFNEKDELMYILANFGRLEIKTYLMDKH